MKKNNEAVKIKVRRQADQAFVWLTEVDINKDLLPLYRSFVGTGAAQEAALSIINSLVKHKSPVVAISPLWLIPLIARDPNRKEPLKINYRAYKEALKTLIDLKFITPVRGVLYKVDEELLKTAIKREI